MASSRRSPPADAACAAVDAAVDRMLAGVAAGATLAVALSGGRDSIVLLDACARLAPARRVPLVALHVHHGLHVEADAWLDFCDAQSAQRGIAFAARRVAIDPRPAEGIEAAARRLRYAALAEGARVYGAVHVALAHTEDDQAETLVLQLARGAGPHGLAAMPSRRDLDGIAWLRPLLDVPRAAIDAVVAARRLAFRDDPSNALPRHRRNALRQALVPAWQQALGGWPATVARAARHQQDAVRLLDDLAAIDAAGAVDARATLARASLVALSPPRARNLLRWFLAHRGLLPPSAARLDAMLAQLADAAADAQIELRHAGATLGVYRGRIVVHATPPASFAAEWHGEAHVALPHGALAFVETSEGGLSPERIRGRSVTIRSRAGGERLQTAPDRPRRALKRLLQEAGLPPWERRALPLVFCDGALAAAPGIGIDVAFLARPGEAGWRLDWHPGTG